MPKVSVIVPNYNHAPFLRQRLDSIFSQTFQDFELILLDDCSTDNSIEILKEYAKHPKVSHFIINDINSGSPFKQWKKGIELAKGEYIWIAESDDWADPAFLSTLLSYLGKEIGLVYCRSINVKNQTISDIDFFWPDILDSDRWKSDFINDGLDEIKNYLVYQNTIPNASSCVFEKRFAVFTPELLQMKTSGDWMFWIYILEKTGIHFTSQKLSYFRSHAKSSRSAKIKMLELNRSREISENIQFARTVSHIGNISVCEIEKYKWLFQEYFNKRKILRWAVFYPPFSFILYIYYYVFIIKQILFSISNKIKKYFF